MKVRVRCLALVTIAALAILHAPEALPISETTPPTVNLSPNPLYFGERDWPWCPAIQRGETLTNDGPGVLDISRIAIGGAGFSQTNTCGSTLGVGKSCSITVTWHGGAGSEQASLVVTDNGVGSPQTVSLRAVCYKA